MRLIPDRHIPSPELVLNAGYIRYELNSEDEVRLRFYHDWNDVVKIQVNSKEQDLPIWKVS